MNDQERARPKLDHRVKISIAAALAAVGLTLNVETPFWPSALGAPPSLGLIVAAVGVVLAAIHYAMLWRRRARRDRA